MSEDLRLRLRAKPEDFRGALSNLISHLSQTCKSIEVGHRDADAGEAILQCEVDDLEDLLRRSREWLETNPKVGIQIVHSGDQIIFDVAFRLTEIATDRLQLPHLLPNSAFTMELRVPRLDTPSVEPGQGVPKNHKRTP